MEDQTKVNLKRNQKAKNQRSNQETRHMQVMSIKSLEGEGNERKFILSFSSEEPYARWWGTEVLDHSNDAVDTTRLSEIGCLLYNHNRDAVIGKVNKVWIEDNRGYAEVEFDEDEESERIYQKVKNGTLKGVSVGYKIDVWEEVKQGAISTDGRFMGPVEIAKKWTPFEISIVSVPADPTVGVGREDKPIEIEEQVNEVRSMSYFEAQLQINKNIGGMN